MLDEEKEQELQAKRELYAGIALPGLIMRYAGTYITHKDIAEEAFKIAQAMIEEGDKWLTTKDEE